NSSVATITVNGKEYVASDHVPRDMGELGLNTRSMWWKRHGSPRSSTSSDRSMNNNTRTSGYATTATDAKVFGAASSDSAAARNRPVVRLLHSTSRMTSPCQLGGLVAGPEA